MDYEAGRWSLTSNALQDGRGWQIETKVSGPISTDDLEDLLVVLQSALGYEPCQKCEIAHRPDRHIDLYNKWLRSLANYDNLLKRNKVDISQAQFDIARKILTELLFLIDNIEAVIKSSDGLSLEEQKILRSSLDSVMQKNDLVPIFPQMAPTNTYNPEWHQAIEMLKDDVLETVIVPVIQGYMWKDKVLRVAQVRILTPNKTEG